MAAKQLTPEEYARKREKERAWERAYRQRHAKTLRQRQRDKYWSDPGKARAVQRKSRRKNYNPDRQKVNQERHLKKIGVEAKRARQRAWYAKNRESELARVAADYQKHKEKRLAYSRQYEADHREARIEKTRRWSAANPDKQLAYRLAHRAEAAARAAAFEAQNHKNRRDRHHERQATDPNYRLRRALRAAIVGALRKKGVACWQSQSRLGNHPTWLHSRRA